MPAIPMYNTGKKTDVPPKTQLWGSRIVLKTVLPITDYTDINEAIDGSPNMLLARELEKKKNQANHLYRAFIMLAVVARPVPE